MKLGFVFSFAVLLTVPAFGANLVNNGSFEQGPAGIGSFNGWQTVLGDPSTFVDSTGQTGTRAGQASDGLWSAYFGSTAGSGGSSISQTLATSPNQAYLLTFDLANDNGGQPASNGFRASIGSGLPTFSATNFASQDYVRRQLSFVATGNSVVLTFSAYNDSGYWQLDNVMATAVPEPSSLTLALIALLVTGGAARFRLGPYVN